MSLAGPADLAPWGNSALAEQVSGGCRRHVSDYERFLADPALGMQDNAGPNDAVMAPKYDLVSQAMIEAGSLVGMDLSRRTGDQDNDFYRDNASCFPGELIDGLPTGAWAQDRATNHVCHDAPEGSACDNVRRALVRIQGGMMDRKIADGRDGSLTMDEVYDAHVEAYAQAGGGGNQFIDPWSFEVAMNEVPQLLNAGIDTGPISGAAINLLNDPDDTAGEGLMKRMVLSGGEAALDFLDVFAPELGVGEHAGDALLWNMATAAGGAPTARALTEYKIDGTTPFDGIVDLGQSAWSGASALVEGIGTGVGTAVDVVDAIGSGVGDVIDTADAIGSGVGSAIDAVGAFGSGVGDVIDTVSTVGVGIGEVLDLLDITVP